MKAECTLYLCAHVAALSVTCVFLWGQTTSGPTKAEESNEEKEKKKGREKRGVGGILVSETKSN